MQRVAGYTAERTARYTAGEAGSGAAPAALLLDTFTGASAAYSLRKLRTAYTGACIRVRRSSDNTEQDIGFAGTVLDTTGLLSFCGVGSGFVTRWYDQSGNGIDAIEATTTIQPLIVSSGVTVVDGTRPALDFATNRQLSVALTVGSPFSIFAVASVQGSGSSYQRIISSSPDVRLFFGALDRNFATFFGDGSNWNDIAANAPPTSIGNRARLAVVHSANIATPTLNGATQNTKSGGVAAGTSLLIGRLHSNNQAWNAPIQELILYGSNQSANVAAIQADQAAFYV